MNKFEYKVETLSVLYGIHGITNYDIERLNRLGDEGWEVCAVDGPKYLLKRKIINMEIKKNEIEKMAMDYVNHKSRVHYPGIEKSYLFEGYVKGIMEFCQKMNINVITNSDD